MESFSFFYAKFTYSFMNRKVTILIKEITIMLDWDYISSINYDVRKVHDVEKYWGDKMPMMAMEEAAELVLAISKTERDVDEYGHLKYENGEAWHNLVEEMRDMFISLLALQFRYGIDNETINKAINEKLNMKKDG